MRHCMTLYLKGYQKVKIENVYIYLIKVEFSALNCRMVPLEVLGHAIPHYWWIQNAGVLLIFKNFNGHILQFSLQKYSNFEQNVIKNDHFVSKMCLMEFNSREALYIHNIVPHFKLSYTINMRREGSVVEALLTTVRMSQKVTSYFILRALLILK